MQNPITTVRDYVRTAWAELQKVTWPTRELTIRYSAIVIAVSIAMAMFFAVLDFGFSRLVTGVIILTKGEQTLPAPTEAPPVTPDVQTTGEAEGVQINSEGADSGEAVTPVDDSPIELEPSLQGEPAPAPEGGLTLPPIQ